MNSELYYKESGKMSAISIVAILITGFITSTILGICYGFIVFYIPFIYLNFIITAIVGFGSGFVIGKVAELTKARNKKIVIGISAIMGFVSLYFGWVFWIYAASEQEVMIFGIGDIFKLMDIISTDGMWTIFGTTPTGGILYTIWAIEAVMVVGITILASIGSSPDKPFCEACETWSEATVTKDFLSPVNNPQELVSSLELNNQSELKKLVSVHTSEKDRTRIIISSCPSCSNTYYLTVEMVLTTINDKGEREDEETPLVKNLIITTPAYKEITNWMEELLQI